MGLNLEKGKRRYVRIMGEKCQAGGRGMRGGNAKSRDNDVGKDSLVC